MLPRASCPLFIQPVTCHAEWAGSAGRQSTKSRDTNSTVFTPQVLFIGQENKTEKVKLDNQVNYSDTGRQHTVSRSSSSLGHHVDLMRGICDFERQHNHIFSQTVSVKLKA